MRLVCSLFLVLVAVVATPLRADPILEYRTVLDEKVRLLVPVEFTVMSDEMRQFKYPRDRPPTLALTNESGSVNLAFNHTPSRGSLADLPKYHEFFRKSDRTLLPAVEWIRDEITTINGRNFILREFRSPAIDTDIHNIMALTFVDGRLLIVAFNTVVELEDEWLATGHKMIESIEIVE
jgi:hypothetical protein